MTTTIIADENSVENPIDNSAEASPLLTVREVASQLRVDDTTVRRWVKSGAMPAIALPHKGKRQAYRFHKSALAAIMEQRAVNSEDQEEAA